MDFVTDAKVRPKLWLCGERGISSERREMNSYARLFCGDQSAYSWVGWKRRVDKQLFFGSILVAVATYAGVYYSEEKERERRHTSIEKDIEREQWRARELGLDEPVDDGFAKRYVQQVQKNR